MTRLYDQDRGGEVLGAAISMIVVATIAVALRFFSRWKSRVLLWWDDWTILVALVLDTGLNICYVIYVVSTWAGRHTTAVGGPVSKQRLMDQNKVLLGILVFYFCNSVAFKISSLLLYYRIFNVLRWFRATLIGAGVIVISYWIICLVLTFTMCRPLKYYWDKSVSGGTCLDQTAFYKWNGLANLLIDLMILCLTLPIVWDLKIELKQKVQITAVFLVGSLVCTAAVVRVATFSELVLEDESYSVITPTVWSIVEQGLGVTCACLPTLGHLFRVRAHNKNAGSAYQSRRPAIDTEREASIMGDTAALARVRDQYLPTVTSKAVRKPAWYMCIEDGNILPSHSIEQHRDLV